MNLTDLVIDAYKTIGSKALLVDVLPSFEYKNGERTEKVIGYKYIVALPDHALEKISVKIEGEKQLEKPETDFPEVQFKELEMSLYWTRQAGYQITSKAASVSCKK